MIKVIKCEFKDYPVFHYLLSLENGDRVIISIKDYNRIMIHTSVNGNLYKTIIDEHEEDHDSAVEYLGFELV